MTYSAGGLIEAQDFNTFVGNATTGLNQIWSTGSGNKGWGQAAIANVSATQTVSVTGAIQWAQLVNVLSTTGAQTTTAITARTTPVTGNVIAILANVQTDINNCTTNRAFATSQGTQYGTFTGTTSKTTATGSGTAAWTITFTHTVTFPSDNQLRYFFNAGGLVRLQYGKSSTGTTSDDDWNTLAGWCGSIYISGVQGAKIIAGVTYTGITRIGGTGGTQTTLSTTSGWYNLTGSPTTIFQLNNTALYTGEFIQTTATATSSTVLTLVTTWVSDGSGATSSANISGGTATASPSTTITGTAPTTLVTYFPPSTLQGLSDTWGTPTIAASVA